MFRPNLWPTSGRYITKDILQKHHIINTLKCVCAFIGFILISNHLNAWSWIIWKRKGYSFFWDFTELRLVVCERRCGIQYLPHLQRRLKIGPVIFRWFIPVVSDHNITIDIRWISVMTYPPYLRCDRTGKLPPRRKPETTQIKEGCAILSSSVQRWWSTLNYQLTHTTLKKRRVTKTF